MARPEEKAQSMLNRYLRSQREKSGENNNNRRRPHLASLCSDLPSGLKWRSQVERDIRLRVTEIHNETLAKERVRELNDTINRLLRERRHWDRRVVQLGGRSIPHGMNNNNNDDGFEHGGYLYFGMARELPEVRELLERRKKQQELLSEDNDDEEGNSAKLYARLSGTQYYNPVYTEDDKEALEACESKLGEALKEEYERPEEGGSEWDRTYEKFIGLKPKNATAAAAAEVVEALEMAKGNDGDGVKVESEGRDEEDTRRIERDEGRRKDAIDMLRRRERDMSKS